MELFLWYILRGDDDKCFVIYESDIRFYGLGISNSNYESNNTKLRVFQFSSSLKV